jgi:hypothetical protein
MSTQQESTESRPQPVAGLPDRPNGKKWYPTLKDAVDAWAHNNDLHGDQKVPDIHVYLHTHIGGWSVE